MLISEGGDKVITYTLMLLLGLKLEMPTAYFVLLGIGATIKTINAGIQLQKKISEK